MHDTTNMVGYARVSTDEQTSVNQIDKLKEFGVGILFKDDGISGKKLALERPDYREMIRYLGTHPDVKTIVVYEISRLGRNMQDSINTFLNLEKQGYRIWSLTEAWTHQEDPNMRNFMILIVSWMNEQELIRISQRTKAGMDRVRKFGSKSGKPIGHPPKSPDRDVVMDLRENKKKSWKFIADTFHMDISTLFRYRRDWKRRDLGREAEKA